MVSRLAAGLLMAALVSPVSADPGALRGLLMAAGPGAVELSPFPSRDTLLERVLARVNVSGNPRERAILEAALRDILRTGTGREIAEGLASEGISVDLRLAEIPGSRLQSMNGRKVLDGTVGYHNHRTKEIVLTRALLGADPAHARCEAATTLAHELLGHALQYARAERAGIPWTLYNHYSGDETNAMLVGWLVLAELDCPLSRDEMWEYLKNPDKAISRKALNHASYAFRMTPSDMIDPLRVMRKRLDAIERRRDGIQNRAISLNGLASMIAHFTHRHGVPAARFPSLKEESDYFFGEVRQDLSRDADKVEAELHGLVAQLASDGRLARDLDRLARSPFIQASERRIGRLEQRLEARAEGRKFEPPVPNAPEQVSEDELERWYAQDLKDYPPGHPHWK